MAEFVPDKAQTINSDRTKGESPSGLHQVHFEVAVRNGQSPRTALAWSYTKWSSKGTHWGMTPAPKVIKVLILESASE